MIKYLKESNFPIGVFFGAIGIWLFMAAVVFGLNEYVIFTGNSILFPFSVVYPSAFLFTGILFGFLFLGVGLLAYTAHQKLNFFWLYILCILLVVLGNLAQGNIDIAFLQPFYFKGRQYYADAINITDWQIWLKDFNQNLESFQLHTKTHPPYTTLIHYLFLDIFKGNILGLSLSFFALSCLSFPLMNQLMKNFDIEKSKRQLILILFAIIPSVNIYLLVSIDGIILTTSLLFFCGLSSVFIKNKISFLSLLSLFIGLVATNLLSFSGLFLFAFLGVISLITLFRKQYFVTITSVIVSVLFVVFFYQLYLLTGSDQLETFLHASRSENKNGFMLLHSPIVYFFTRLEDVVEILFFLSFAYLAYFFSFKNDNIKMFANAKINIFSFSGIIALGVMFLTGAYGTGETARACLFIVPLFVLFLKDLQLKDLSVIYLLCLLQTFGMQTIGNYYW